MTHSTRRVNRASACAAAAFFALGAATAPIAAASADPPSKEPASQTVTSVVNDLCGFPVTVTAVQNGFVINSADGLTQFYQLTEQDVFSANGKTLAGLPYSYAFHVTYDADGNITSFYGTGVTVRVPISQGVTFRGAGRLDFLQGSEDFQYLPQSGGSQSHDAFCAALAP